MGNITNPLFKSSHWGFLLGRPFRISLEDVTVQKPGLLAEPNEAQRWCPYWLPYPTLFPAGLSIPHTASQLSLQRVTLAEIMTPLGHILYVNLDLAFASVADLSQIRIIKAVQRGSPGSQCRNNG